MKILILILLLVLFLFLETSSIALPLSLVLLLVIVSQYNKLWIFPFAFFLGIVLDVLAFRSIGISSIFFVSTCGLVWLYQKKFEIQTPQFVFFATCVSSFVYLLIIGVSFPILQALLSGSIGVLLFMGLTFIKNTQKEKISLTPFHF